jgi:hypothetical protein
MVGSEGAADMRMLDRAVMIPEEPPMWVLYKRLQSPDSTVIANAKRCIAFCILLLSVLASMSPSYSVLVTRVRPDKARDSLEYGRSPCSP